MRHELSEIVGLAGRLDAAQERDTVAGLAEWLALQAWRANWWPQSDPAQSVNDLAVVLRCAMAAGYAAYRARAKAMPVLFALESVLARGWQDGFAMARREAQVGVDHACI